MDVRNYVYNVDVRNYVYNLDGSLLKYENAGAGDPLPLNPLPRPYPVTSNVENCISSIENSIFLKNQNWWGPNDSFFGQLSYKCYLEGVASVGLRFAPGLGGLLVQNWSFRSFRKILKQYKAGITDKNNWSN